MLVRTQLLYNLPLVIKDMSLLVSSDTSCLNLFQPIRILPPQLHQHLHPHSACHLGNKTYPLTPNFALAPISTLLRPALVTGFKQPLQMNEFATFDMLPFIPLHFLCTHFWQLVHCNELLLTPLLQTPHGHLTAFCLTF